MKNVDYNQRLGTGSEIDPFYSQDGTAGVQTGLDNLAERGGKIELKCGRYDIEKTIVLDTPSLCLAGEVWSCNIDPNGVFEPKHGTKIRMKGNDYPALAIGRYWSSISGAIVRDLGFQGDIPGMDTRPIVDFSEPKRAAGLCFDSVRTDQCEFSKLSFCGMAYGVCATGNAEIDACVYERLNVDGCGIGFYFSPRASYYARFRYCIVADTPFYGFYANGADKGIHNFEILDSHFVRNGGGFQGNDGHQPAAVLFDHISRCSVTHCIFDAPGTFWYYDDDATENNQRQPSQRKAIALCVIGNENRVRDNTFLNSSDDSIYIEGNGNVLLSNIVDGNVRIRGKNNTIANLIFTKPDSRLILEGDAKYSTLIIGVPEERITRI